jgi:hypothetical protein
VTLTTTRCLLIVAVADDAETSAARRRYLDTSAAICCHSVTCCWPTDAIDTTARCKLKSIPTTTPGSPTLVTGDNRPWLLDASAAIPRPTDDVDTTTRCNQQSTPTTIQAQLGHAVVSATPLSRPWPCHHHAMVSPPQSCRRVVSATLVSRIGNAVVSARTRPRLVLAMSTPRPSLFP